MFHIAAKTLSKMTTEEDFANETLYPGLSSIRNISFEIAVSLIEYAYQEGFARRTPYPKDNSQLRKHLTAFVYNPEINFPNL